MVFNNTGSYKLGFLTLITIVGIGFSLVLLLKPVKKKSIEEIT